MTKTILSLRQRRFIDFFVSNLYLKKNFYLSGGTCLSEFYLQHRYSEDLDFFSENEIDVRGITSFLKQSKKNLGYTKIDFQTSFNRNIYQLIFNKKDFLKVEFSYFPFESIDQRIEKNGLIIDSLKDIAVNKVFSLIQNPRGRDYFDLYFILKKTNWRFIDILKLARIKFDYQIDYLQVGSQLIRFQEFKDDPIMKNKKDYFQIIDAFFKNISKSLKEKIIKNPQQ